MSGRDVAKYLADIGCCKRCILIYLGERSDVLYGSLQSLDGAIEQAVLSLDNQQLTSTIEDKINSNTSSECDSQNKSAEEENFVVPEYEEENCIGSTNGHAEHVSKKQKLSAVCITCIGLFQLCNASTVIKQISDAMAIGNPDTDSFALGFALPVSLTLRVHRVWVLVMQAFPWMPDKGRKDHIGTLKDAWKNLVGPQLEKLLDKTFVQAQNVDFIMNVCTSYVNDTDDCKILDTLCGNLFHDRRKQPKKFAAGVYSKQAVDAAIKKLSDREFLRACPAPPPMPAELIAITELKWQRDALFMAGRYNKYSRELPQTPWIVEGERKMGSSVQELFCEILNKTIRAEDYRFSSSGREDVDVRCLGNGRPFVVEFINPCCTKLSQEEVKELQKSVNVSSNLIQLRDLQIVDKKDVWNLKEGEEEKTKAYCALCVVRTGYDPALLSQLSEMKELIIQQQTPLRVLHRRALMTRPKVIHEMSASPVNNFLFKLHLTTQAGTYIKEFVHGDLGRTQPNMGNILGLDVDIIALDVENVSLDWPPRYGD
ncbi:putative tRNA pseudouridine synthase Pus10 [Halocaridina rubra]|uniref:tRNA pseudouridine(55) synthase n=1 Tax=Halocaridina rubra TaxID=373956 RepID=A0AAN8WXK1_HALRR